MEMITKQTTGVTDKEISPAKGSAWSIRELEGEVAQRVFGFRRWTFAEAHLRRKGWVLATPEESEVWERRIRTQPPSDIVPAQEGDAPLRDAYRDVPRYTVDSGPMSDVLARIQSLIPSFSLSWKKRRGWLASTSIGETAVVGIGDSNGEALCRFLLAILDSEAGVPA